MKQEQLAGTLTHVQTRHSTVKTAVEVQIHFRSHEVQQYHLQGYRVLRYSLFVSWLSRRPRGMNEGCDALIDLWYIYWYKIHAMIASTKQLYRALIASHHPTNSYRTLIASTREFRVSASALQAKPSQPTPKPRYYTYHCDGDASIRFDSLHSADKSIPIQAIPPQQYHPSKRHATVKRREKIRGATKNSSGTKRRTEGINQHDMTYGWMHR